MATIINNPTPVTPARSTNGTGFLLGAILLIALIAFLLLYGLPVLRSMLSVPQVNVPAEIDVNVSTPK